METEANDEHTMMRPKMNLNAKRPFLADIGKSPQICELNERFCAYYNIDSGFIGDRIGIFFEKFSPP